MKLETFLFSNLPYSFIANDIDGTLSTWQRVISARNLITISAGVAEDSVIQFTIKGV